MANYHNTTDDATLLPRELSHSILTNVAHKSVVASLVPSKTLTKPRQTFPLMGDVTAAWTDEAALKPVTKAVITPKYLDTYKMATIVTFTDEDLDDTSSEGFNLISMIKGRCEEAVKNTLDQTCLGYQTAPGANFDQISQNVSGSVAYGAGVDLGEDTSNAMGLVEASGFEPTGFAAPLNSRKLLRNLRDENHNPIYAPIAGANPATLHDLPIVHSKNMIASTQSPALKEMIVGDWNKAFLGLYQDITYKVLTEGRITYGDATYVDLGQQDIQALRLVFRAAFVVLTGPDDDFPFAKVTGIPLT